MKKYILLGLILTLVLALALVGCGGGGGGGNGDGDGDNSGGDGDNGGGSTSTLPSPWQHQDIGTGMSAGSVGYQNGTFTITGAGKLGDLTEDQLHFVYQTINGNFTIIARVASMEEKTEFASAGLMVRNSLDPNSQMFNFYVRPEELGYMGSRKTVGDQFSSGYEEKRGIPIYLKLVGNGDDFSGYYSIDGINWSPSVFNDHDTFEPNPVEMNDPVYVGMFVYSYTDNTLETATFDHVAIDTTP